MHVSMSRTKLILTAVLLLADTGGAIAADRPGHVAFRHYGSDDGLSALDVVVGIQDREGFIWAASPNGLFRYDGLRFRRFSVADGLPSTLVTDMANAPDGVLWGATSRGLFYESHDRFVAIGNDVLPVDGMHLLAFDPEGRTWITTSRGPFVVVAPQQVVPVPGWPGGEAFGILIEPGGVMIGRGSRLLVRSRGGTAFEDVGHDFIEPITHIIRDGSGRLWLRAGEHLWMQPHTGAAFQDRSSSYLGAPVGSDGLRLALSVTKTLLIPTALGLIEVDGEEAHFIKTDLPDDARSIKSVWIDREGSLWLTSLGLHHELGRGLWRTLSTRDELRANNVWSIAGVHGGRAAIGTDVGVTLVGGDRTELIDVPSVVSIIEQPADVLWIASARKLVRYEISTQRRLDLGTESGLPDRKLSVVATDREGNVWVGYSGGGLYRSLASAAPRFERVIVPDGEDAAIAGIAIDGERLWVTTSHGLHVRDRGVWHRFSKRDGLRDDGVMFVAVRKNHEVCTSYLSPYGLTCMRYADGSISELRHIDDTTGLNSPVPYFVTEDAAGRLWVGGAQGVSIFHDDGVDHFTRASGAPGDDCNANASWVSPTGDVWIGTSSGVGIFAGARYGHALEPPTVRLQRGQLGGAELDFGIAHPSVPYQQARFEVELTAMSYVDEHLEYEVRLIGFDDDWHRVEGGDARYHKLPPGNYQFAARARYRDGVWGQPTMFAFVVEPPFWKTRWFIALVTCAGAFAIALGVRWRLRALVRRNLELEDTIRERTRDLVVANEKLVHTEKLAALGRLLAQLSHEINNPLNVIHNNIMPLEEYSQTLSGALSSCKELVSDPAARAKLDEIWNELELDYVISDSAQAFAIMKIAVKRIVAINRELKAFLHDEPPEREPTDLLDAVRTTVAMMARGLPDVEIRCNLEPLPLVSVNSGRINQTLANLVQNAADSMHRAGQITISTRAEGGTVQIRVADSGPGVPTNLRSKIFEPFFTTKEIGMGLGLGLSICREIVVAHGGSLELDPSYQTGACFVIALPLDAATPIQRRLES